MDSIMNSNIGSDKKNPDVFVDKFIISGIQNQLELWACMRASPLNLGLKPVFEFSKQG